MLPKVSTCKNPLGIFQKVDFDSIGPAWHLGFCMSDMPCLYTLTFSPHMGKCCGGSFYAVFHGAPDPQQCRTAHRLVGEGQVWDIIQGCSIFMFQILEFHEKNLIYRKIYMISLV